MPQSGPRRNNVAVRLRDEELAVLRERGAIEGRSISDIARDLMGLPPGDRVLARRSEHELRRDIDRRTSSALAGDIAAAMTVCALHRVLEPRSPASAEEFLSLYAVRLRVSPDWLADGSFRTVEVDPDLLLEIEFGGRGTHQEPGVRIAPRIPSRDLRLPSATYRTTALPAETEMRRLLEDAMGRARALARAASGD